METHTPASSEDPTDLSVGDTAIPYEDDTLVLKVVRVTQEEFLVKYQRKDTGKNLLVMRVNAGPNPNSIDTSEFDPSFWEVTVDGESRPSENLKHILASENITDTAINRGERRIEFTTEGR